MENNLLIIKKFVEGEMSKQDFKNSFFENTNLQNMISTYNPAMSEKYGGTLNLMKGINWDNPIRLREIQLIMELFLMRKGVTCTSTDKYQKDASTFYNLLPAWIGEDAEDYVIDEIIEKAPKGLTKVELKKWVKERISETFRCEKSKPRWAQGGEWPRMPDGRFMIFRSQKKDGELVTYTFVNPDTGEEVKIEEYY